MKETIINGKVILEDQIVEKNIILEDDKIVEISNRIEGETIDAAHNYVSPGFIDLHTHGREQHDTMYASFEQLNAMTLAHMKTGVTSFLPTTVTSPIEEIAAACDNIALNKDKVEGSKILGIHLEGPFINKKYKGAQPESAIIAPTLDNYRAITHGHEDIISKITLAPEMEGSYDLIEYLVQKGVSVSVGHTNATYEETKEAFDRGANSTTHTFNAMTPLHHRKPGVVGAVMNDSRVYAELILDGKHVVFPSAKALVNSLDKSKVVLISDSLEAAGMPVGQYMLGSQKIWVKDGRAELEDGTIAGSIAGLNEEVRNAVRFLNVSLVDAVNFASRNPADSIGHKELGRIKEGCIADFVIFDEDFNVKNVIINGNIKL